MHCLMLLKRTLVTQGGEAYGIIWGMQMRLENKKANPAWSETTLTGFDRSTELNEGRQTCDPYGTVLIY